MSSTTKNQWRPIFTGKLFVIEKHDVKGFEKAVRPPGVRLILKNKKDEILLTKEFRAEQNKYDFRLPGGKVFDDLESYLAVRRNQDKLNKSVLEAGKLEAKQEAGIGKIDNLSLYTKSVAGATIEWDLYYLTGNVSELGDQELDGDEADHGIAVDFYNKDTIIEMLKNGEISEDRTVAVLFKYLLK